MRPIRTFCTVRRDSALRMLRSRVGVAARYHFVPATLGLGCKLGVYCIVLPEWFRCVRAICLAGGVCDMPTTEIVEEKEDASWQRRHNLVMGEQRVDKDKEAAYFQFRCVSIGR
jgi:hypothetical protein